MPRIPRDHYVPKTYLRGFTTEFLNGTSGERLAYLYPGLSSFPTAVIADLVACEPDFYAGHPLDKHWSATIENDWPKLRNRLKARDRHPDLQNALFWFAAAQFLRTPAFLKRVANRLSFSKAQTFPVTLDGRSVKGMVVDMAPTFDCIEEIEKHWPMVRADMSSLFRWSVYHVPNTLKNYFFTSDNPCAVDLRTGRITLPLSLTMALRGTPVSGLEIPNFRHRAADPITVAEINRATVRACTSHVFAHEGTPELLQFVSAHWSERHPSEMGRGFARDPKRTTQEDFESFMLRFNRLREKEREAAAGTDS